MPLQQGRQGRCRRNQRLLCLEAHNEASLPLGAQALEARETINASDLNTQVRSRLPNQLPRLDCAGHVQHHRRIPVRDDKSDGRLGQVEPLRQRFLRILQALPARKSAKCGVRPHFEGGLLKDIRDVLLDPRLGIDAMNDPGAASEEDLLHPSLVLDVHGQHHGGIADAPPSSGRGGRVLAHATNLVLSVVRVAAALDAVAKRAVGVASTTIEALLQLLALRDDGLDQLALLHQGLLRRPNLRPKRPQLLC
mmetsp:Transcript_60694/g.198689  ORF Transcript_60694/g.198689 Transcript_60694/m.198689 type:complete len:251 (-) Transcript_60694:254-1006(-)